MFAPDGQPDQTVLIIDVNPYMHGLSATPPMNMKPEFHPDAVYRITVAPENKAEVYRQLGTESPTNRAAGSFAPKRASSPTYGELGSVRGGT